MALYSKCYNCGDVKEIVIQCDKFDQNEKKEFLSTFDKEEIMIPIKAVDSTHLGFKPYDIMLQIGSFANEKLVLKAMERVKYIIDNHKDDWIEAEDEWVKQIVGRIINVIKERQGVNHGS